MTANLYSSKSFTTAARNAALVVGLVWTAMTWAHGTYHDRMANFEAALARNPDDGWVLLQRADEKCEHGDWQDALADVARVEALDPGLYPTDLLRGQCLLAAGNPAEAKVALDRFLERQSRHLRALTLRARVHLALENTEASLADFRAALALPVRLEPELFQEAADAFAKAGKSDEAVQILANGIAQLGPIPSLSVRAMELEMATGRYDAALTRVDALQKVGPRPEPWMAKRAELLKAAGRPGEARAAWEALIAHLAALPNLERGSHAMSLLAERARREIAELPASAKSTAAPAGDIQRRTLTVRPGSNHEEEMHRANEQVVAAPADARPWFNRALLLLLDGEWAQCIADCVEAERLAPGELPTDYVRAQALAGQGHLAEGRALLDQFLATHPDHSRAFAARARIALALRDTDGGLADFRRALTLSGDTAPDVDLVSEIVTAFAVHGRRAEALAIANAALARLGPITSLTHAALELETSLGRFDDALSHVDALQKSAPRPEAWMARRAEILSAAGRADEARAAWQALLSRIEALPTLQRGSREFSQLSSRAIAALQTLSVVQTSSASPSHP